ncbi:spastin [Anaeramoeba flamelloides]|uniref:Spastin n=1 Tax=Anaeramoeba flamelloides TaxID=1746091 RepID=A0AAV7YV09_9EUKA|nr:spastin [Anaeramoeba flamelloides]
MTNVLTNLKKQELLFEEAKVYIDLAITQENENIGGGLAVKNYLYGRQRLERALSINFTKSEQEKSMVTQQKMVKILKSVNERLKELKKIEMREILLLKQQQQQQQQQQSRQYRNTNQTSQTTKQSNSIFNRNKSSQNNLDNTQEKKSKGIARELLQTIENEIVDRADPVSFDDIAGLKNVKQALHESIILPNKRPEIFKGLRRPAKGILLFGPPGNGKTMIARATAAAANCTFFSITAASLTSKYVGEGEKLVRALFFIARERQPSIIFIDEIDSLLGKRGGQNELESSRRIKNEFLTQIEGVTSKNEDRVLLIAATNRPHDLDEAVLRRFRKKIYVPPPNEPARKVLLSILLKKEKHKLRDSSLTKVAKQTIGYSGSDLRNLTQEAAMFPVRELGSQIETINEKKIRPVLYKDFTKALKFVNPSISKKALLELEEWNQQYGCN